MLTSLKRRKVVPRPFSSWLTNSKRHITYSPSAALGMVLRLVPFQVPTPSAPAPQAEDSSGRESGRDYSNMQPLSILLLSYCRMGRTESGEAGQFAECRTGPHEVPAEPQVSLI